MALTLANLIIKVRADTGTLATDLKKIGTTAGRTAKKIGSMESPLTSFLVAGAGLAIVGKQIFELGANVEETGSKFRTVFGESTKSVEGFIDRFATVAGLSREQAQAILATTGSIVQGMGLAQEASAQYATQVVQLAGDLASFNNIPITETALAIQAAITGEREQLKRLGIVILETDVQKRALLDTGKSLAKSLTQEEKATATLALITARAGVAIGDLERTKFSAANQARALGAEILNIKETLASSLLPVMSFVLTKFGEFIKGLQIMGAEAAVFGAAIVVMVSRLKFWDKEGMTQAIRSLEFMKIAAEETKLGIVGLTNSTVQLNGEMGRAADKVSELGNNLQETAGQGVRPLIVDMSGLGDELRLLTPLFETVGDVGVRTFNDIAASARSANVEISDLDTKLSSFGSKLGRLATIIGIFGGNTQLLSKGASLAGALAGGFAHGGSIPAGKFGIVGEAGPEIVTGPATVTPIRAGGGVTVHQVINFNVSAIDSRDAGRFIQEQKGAIAKMMAQASRDSLSYRRALAGA